ncbi:hypothetical protein [Streptomyces graminilatus]|uniref:hypothetical protein n=1 Tax=Streptomyces graminilatus TaxID=1464070 RepID=UPI0006E32BEC|nr:hypothetical protein [Streptomyces graminilatus]
MPADEVNHGLEVDEARERTGPRHAAPKKPLFTRFHVPAGKAIALAAMPTAVLMGMGFTPTLARADAQAKTNSLTAEEYKACVAAMEDGTSPSAASAPKSPHGDSGKATATPSAPAAPHSGGDAATDEPTSPDPGSDDPAKPAPAPTSTPSAGKPAPAGGGDTGGESGKGTPAPTPSADKGAPEEAGGGLLDTIGDAITGILKGGGDSSADTKTTAPEPTKTTDPAETAAPTPVASPTPRAEVPDKGKPDSTTVKKSPVKVTKVVKDTAGDAAKGTTETAGKVAATPSPSPSASETTDADTDNCPAAATKDRGGVDNTIPLPVDPWILEASTLTLKGADYQGIVKVRTADGTVKDVLKFVVSGGTDIGNLHQIVKDRTSGKTYHVEAMKSVDPQKASKITGGKTIMYTESISGNLLGLFPVTFSPKNPPPLNIPLIFFTNVKVVQAGQFGGTLTIPGMHQYIT